MAWLICGSVPQENFTLDEGPWNLDDGMLFPVPAIDIMSLIFVFLSI